MTPTPPLTHAIAAILMVPARVHLVLAVAVPGRVQVLAPAQVPASAAVQAVPAMVRVVLARVVPAVQVLVRVADSLRTESR